MKFIQKIDEELNNENKGIGEKKEIQKITGGKNTFESKSDF